MNIQIPSKNDNQRPIPCTFRFSQKKVLAPFSFFVTIVSLLILVLWGQLVQAQVNSSDMLDFVLILDESGSMRYNDTDRIRVASSKIFCDLLHPEDRMAIIGFGDGSREITPLVKIGSGNNRLMNGLNSVGVNTTRLPQGYARYSMLGDALKAAEDLLSKRTSQRASVIVVLTDGEFQKDDIPSRLDLNEYLEEMYRTSRSIGTKKTKVVVCAFTQKANLQVLERISREGGGFVERIDTPEAITDVFLKILKLLPGVADENMPAGVKSMTFEVAPNTWKLSLLAIKDKLDNPPVQMTLSDSSGQLVEVEIRDGRLYTVLNITNPSPGKYTVTAPIDGRLEIQIIKRLAVSLHVISPDAGERLVVTGNPLPVKILVRGGEISQMTGELVTPDGDVLSLTMHRKANDSIWTTSINPSLSGTYHTSFAIASEKDSYSGASAILQFTAVKGTEGNMRIEPGLANIGSPIIATSIIPQGIPIGSQLMIIAGPTSIDSIPLTEKNTSTLGIEYYAEYNPDANQPGIYNVTTILKFSQNTEALIQRAEQICPKVLQFEQKASHVFTQSSTFNFNIIVKNYGPPCRLVFNSCESDRGLVTSVETDWQVDTDESVTLSFLANFPDLAQPFNVNFKGTANVEGLGTYPISMMTTVNSVAKPPISIWVWLLIALGIVILLLVICKLRSRIKSKLILSIADQGIDVQLNYHRKFCSNSIFANKDLILDPVLSPKALKLRILDPDSIEVTLLSDEFTEERENPIFIEDELLQVGVPIRVFSSMTMKLPSGIVEINKDDLDIDDIDVLKDFDLNE